MPVGSGQRISVVFTPIKIRISPNIIRLLSAVGANMAAPTEPSAREKQAMLTAKQRVWEQKSVAECNFWFLNEGWYFDCPLIEFTFLFDCSAASGRCH